MTDFTRAWGASYEALPPDSGEAASIGASRIRQTKLDLRERMSVDHKWNDNLAAASTDGSHSKVTLGQRAAPAQIADTIIVYAFDYNNGSDIKTELYAIDEAGNAIRLTERGVIALLKSRNSWAKGQVTPEVALVDAATVAVDASLSNAFKVTLAANRILGEPTNGIAGQTISIRVIQDVVGGRTLDLAAFSGDSADDLDLSTGAADEDLLVLYCAGVNDWRVVNLKKDFANAF